MNGFNTIGSKIRVTDKAPKPFMYKKTTPRFRGVA